MKAFQKIRSTSGVPHEVELYDLRLDNLVRIENQCAGLTIRATRDQVSQGAQDSFIHYLASEGFIAETYRWASANSGQGRPQIRWVTDGSWVRFRHRRIRMATRVWAYLTWGRLWLLALLPVAVAATIWFKHH
jgi:hypothetical protein